MQGRKLIDGTKGSTSFSYSYNSDGLRTTKRIGNQTYTYYWNGTQLAAMTVSNSGTVTVTMCFYYNAEGTPLYFTYNGTEYFYVTNLQGDVMGIANGNGNVGYYEYDAWGKILTYNGIGSTDYSAITYNPLRYRGYIYDNETGFYLTGTRYYDPEIGRFINADNQISGVGSDIRGYNLFAYCFNNPVNMSDPTGNWPRWITATVAAVAAVVAVVATVVSAPVVATVAATVAVVSTVAYVAQSHHYDKRKAKNTNLPKTPQEADDLNWKNSNPKSDINPNGGGPAADCHQYTSPDKSNVKFVSPDGHREVIYNSTGNMVLDSRDIGTYNYSPSGTFWGSIGHFFADMLPWYLFGNDDDDPGPLANEIIRLFE